MENKFNFSGYPGGETEVVYNTTDYGDPSSETETRKQLSYPLYEIKKFINETLFDDAEENLTIRAENLPYANTTNADGLMTHQEKAKLATYPATAWSAATTEANGLMSSADKTKLEAHETKLNGYPDTFAVATGSTDGLMSHQDKLKVGMWGNLKPILAARVPEYEGVYVPVITWNSEDGFTPTLDTVAVQGMIPGTEKVVTTSYLQSDDFKNLIESIVNNM